MSHYGHRSEVCAGRKRTLVHRSSLDRLQDRPSERRASRARRFHRESGQDTRSVRNGAATVAAAALSEMSPLYTKPRRVFIMRFLVALGMAIPVAVQAQLLPPNAAGVTMGHVHLNVKNVEAQKKFWVELFGATPLQREGLEGVKVP